jgi:hypothetical protein
VSPLAKAGKTKTAEKPPAFARTSARCGAITFGDLNGKHWTQRSTGECA